MLKKFVLLVAFVVLAVVVAGCTVAAPTVPFATGWSGTMTDQYSNLYGVAFGTQSGVWAIVHTSGSYAAGATLNVNTRYPNATVKMVDSVGDWIQFSGTYGAAKYTGSWTSSLSAYGSFSMSKDVSVQSLSLRGSPVALSQLLR